MALILPGVGAFPDAMDTIERLSLDKIIKEEVAKNKPLLRNMPWYAIII